MSAERFSVSEINPNESVGGGGCLCSETSLPESEGPYVVFHHAETSSNLSPHAVVCAGCIRAAAQAIEGEALAAGEQDHSSSAGSRDHAREELPVAESTTGGIAGDEDVPEV